MVSYTQNELLSITDFAKSLSKVLGEIKEQTLEKVGVLKNNKLEAVVISTDEYERLKEIENKMEMLEHKEIKPDFIVQNIDDAKNRITTALNNNSYTSHNEFWNEMEVYTNSL